MLSRAAVRAQPCQPQYLFVVFWMSTYSIYMGHRPCAALPGSYRHILFLAILPACHHLGTQKTYGEASARAERPIERLG